jgi:hypothetical protein
VFLQPALIGGLVIGVLSVLPIVSAGNCCCLWVVSGGLVAAYLLQQRQSTPITQGDGALVGLMAGLTGAFVYVILKIPMDLVMAPMERELFRRILENANNMPPEARRLLENYGGPGVRVIGFVFFLFAGAIFSTLGGLLGAVMFRKPQPPVAPDGPPSPA